MRRCPQCKDGYLRIRTSRRIGADWQEQRLECACGYQDKQVVSASTVRRRVVTYNKSS